VQRAGDIGRRNDDAERIAIGALVGLERAGGLPCIIEAGFDIGRVVMLVEHDGLWGICQEMEWMAVG
jgi:hypothetical protein